MLHLRCRVLGLFAILGCLLQLQPADCNDEDAIALNTTCEDVTITIDRAEVRLGLPGTSLNLELSTLLERTSLTLYHSTETSRNELSFHQIAEGSRVTHELGIEVFYVGNVSWTIRFIGDSSHLSGLYEIDIG